MISFELKHLNKLNAKFDYSFFAAENKRKQRFNAMFMQFQHFEYDMIRKIDQGLSEIIKLVRMYLLCCILKEEENETFKELI